MSEYVIYHGETNKTYGRYPYDTERGAKIALARGSTRTKNRIPADCVVLEYQYYLMIKALVTRKIVVKNLMTGADVLIDEDTPLCCDPSSETYWSM